MEFFTKHYKPDNQLDFDNTTFQTIIMDLYNDIIKGNTWAQCAFDELKVNINKIDIISQIPIPVGFTSKYLNADVRNNILNNAQYVINYSFSINNRKIDISFIIEEDTYDSDLYDSYIKKIMSWIYVADKYSTNSCGTHLKLYLYMNNAKKTLPKSRWEVIDMEHVNSGLSDICRHNSEIIIYRKEEWFKVLIHETFHNYGLDFSVININPLKPIMINHFNIESDFAMYETYTEFWARIINIIYCANSLNCDKSSKGKSIKSRTTKSKSTFDEFYAYFKILLYYERIYSIFQCTKILHFMNLTYNNLIMDKHKNKSMQLYKENTNVFPYYIGVAILMVNPVEFIIKCNTDNINIFRFKKTHEAVEDFFTYIITNSILKSTIKVFTKMNKLISKTPKDMLYSCRMSMVETNMCI